MIIITIGTDNTVCAKTSPIIEFTKGGRASSEQDIAVALPVGSRHLHQLLPGPAVQPVHVHHDLHRPCTRTSSSVLNAGQEVSTESPGVSTGVSTRGLHKEKGWRMIGGCVRTM